MKRHATHNFGQALELLASSRPCFFLKLAAALGSAKSAPSADRSVEEAAD